MIYKWVLASYQSWYFIEYNSPEDFVGWTVEYFSKDKKLKMYTSDTPSIFKAAERWRLGKVVITNSYPKNLKKNQWAKFLTADRRNFPRQMIKDVFQ